MKNLPNFKGRCLSGAIKYEVAADPGKENAYFCGKCKRATGAPVPSFFGVPRKRVASHDTPTVNASSDTVPRAFCQTCGTPMGYAGNGSTTWGLTAGTAGLSIPPDVVFYYDQHPKWIRSFSDLPKPDFDDAACGGNTITA